MVSSREDIKRHALDVIDALPDESLTEVVDFLDFQQFKLDKQHSDSSASRPLALGGLLRGVRIDEDDIADVRREMWARFVPQGG